MMMSIHESQTVNHSTSLIQYLIR